MKEKIIKNSKGITLVALVVTIIVLIILAAVSINLIISEDGIISKAKLAKERTEQAQLNEEIAFNKLTQKLDTIVGGTNTPTEPDTPEEPVVEYAPYDAPYMPAGFTHTGGTWNSGYTITETATGNKFVWVPCVLDQNKVKDGDTVTTFGRVLPSTSDTTDPYYKYNEYNLTITGEENPASAIRTSVGTYGGFYIAAYEAGIEGTTENYKLETKVATDGSVKPLSQEGKGVWNYISRSDAITVASSMVNTSDGVKSGLISGEAWDTTLQWMVNASENSANEPNAGYDIDSTGNGVYDQTTRELTGQYPINNIYDMAGNVYEWTTENCTDDGYGCLVVRGGSYDGSGSFYPAAYRGNGSDRATSNIGFRVLLYKVDLNS